MKKNLKYIYSATPWICLGTAIISLIRYLILFIREMNNNSIKDVIVNFELAMNGNLYKSLFVISVICLGILMVTLLGVQLKESKDDGIHMAASIVLCIIGALFQHFGNMDSAWKEIVVRVLMIFPLVSWINIISKKSDKEFYIAMGSTLISGFGGNLLAIIIVSAIMILLYFLSKPSHSLDDEVKVL